MLDTHGIIKGLRLITGASHLTLPSSCFTISKPALSVCDESQQPSRHGSAGFVLSGEIAMQLTDQDIKRFWSKVDKSDECWVWTGRLTDNGYGQFGILINGKQTPRLAHRLIYFLTYGIYPEGMEIRRTCKNSACVHPDHLLLITREERQKQQVATFWSYVDKTPSCWIWIGPKNKEGYGQFHIDLGIGRKNYRAHRVAYILTKGAIPDGQLVRHECDNPSCVNPDHLILGTTIDNVGDRIARRRDAVGEQSGKAKITTEQVRAARARYAAGEAGICQLARENGIAPSTMGDIIHRRKWKHVE